MPIGKLLEWIVNANVSNTRRCFEAAFWDTLGGAKGRQSLSGRATDCWVPADNGRNVTPLCFSCLRGVTCVKRYVDFAFH